MTPRQLDRLEVLDNIESQTPAERAEHTNLRRLHSEMQQAFTMLAGLNMNPTWVGGEYIVANGRSVVRNLFDAYRLARA